jgi:hypothetical protein
MHASSPVLRTCACCSPMMPSSVQFSIQHFSRKAWLLPTTIIAVWHCLKWQFHRVVVELSSCFSPHRRTCARTRRHAHADTHTHTLAHLSNQMPEQSQHVRTIIFSRSSCYSGLHIILFKVFILYMRICAICSMACIIDDRRPSKK